MASPNSVATLMPSSRNSLVLLAENNDEIDLSVLFQTPNIATPDFLLEIDSVLADMKNDRANVDQYFMEMTKQMDDQMALLKAELKAKDSQIERIYESHREKERSSQAKINAIRSEYQSMENVNLLSTVYFKEKLKLLAGVVCDGEEFIKSIDCPNNAELEEPKNDGTEPAVMVVSSDEETDDEAMPNESTIEHEKPTVAIDQPGPSNAGVNTSVLTDDESVVGVEKENVAPVSNAPAIQTADDKTAKAVKSVCCKWCEEIVPKKSWAQHKFEVHKMPIKDIKPESKLGRVLKRKHAADEQSDDEVSISSVTRPSLVPLRARGQCINKPKKAKKMVTSSPA